MSLVSGKSFQLITLLLIWIVAIYYIFSKREIWIRRLAALDFIDESVGRAAEMGRAVTCHGFGDYDTGLESSSSPAIFAGIAVLGHVARVCARFGTPIYATMRAGNVIPVAEEVLRTAYRLEGKLSEFEAKKEEMLPWVATRQAHMALGFRVKPACNIMIGPFWNEAIQIAEVYGRVGAVQIGGTASTTQIPFLAACMDMSLIGEEIYAIGAYIDKGRSTLASLATTDLFKVILGVIVVLGVILATLGPSAVSPLINLFKW